MMCFNLKKPEQKTIQGTGKLSDINQFKHFCHDSSHTCVHESILKTHCFESYDVRIISHVISMPWSVPQTQLGNLNPN